MKIDELSAWIESKVAPEPLIAVQAFANTQESAFGDEEMLPDPAGAREWLVGYDLAAPGIRIDPADLERLRRMRRCLRALIDANMTGDQDLAANAELAAIAAGHPVPLRVGAELHHALAARPDVQGLVPLPGDLEQPLLEPLLLPGDDVDDRIPGADQHLELVGRPSGGRGRRRGRGLRHNGGWPRLAAKGRVGRRMVSVHPHWLGNHSFSSACEGLGG